MKYRLSKTVAAIAAVAVMAAFSTVPSAVAHHSHSMFDLTTTQTITGSVKTFVFQNPHVFLFVDVANPDTGKPTTYAIEMSHVQNTLSHGITAATFKPGDSVTIKMNPLHGGRPGGQYVTIATDGKEYTRGAGE
jgi:hypothetical protein